MKRFQISHNTLKIFSFDMFIRGFMFNSSNLHGSCRDIKLGKKEIEEEKGEEDN